MTKIILWFVILWILYHFYKNDTLEKFTDNDFIYEKIYHRCNYQADVKYSCPIMAKSKLFSILPYELVNDNIKKDVLLNLQKEWKDYKKKDFIISNWQNQNIFYVLTTSNQDELIGTIAIDRKLFLPFISQLYVIDKHRKKGFAKKLLNFANKYVKSLGFNESRLWCNEHLVNFYGKLNWKIENKSGNKYIMVRRL
jgi:GNAT superfamily N-acetyltransferase